MDWESFHIYTNGWWMQLKILTDNIKWMFNYRLIDQYNTIKEYGRLLSSVSSSNISQKPSYHFFANITPTFQGQINKNMINYCWRSIQGGRSSFHSDNLGSRPVRSKGYRYHKKCELWGVGQLMSLLGFLLIIIIKYNHFKITIKPWITSPLSQIAIKML